MHHPEIRGLQCTQEVMKKTMHNLLCSLYTVLYTVMKLCEAYNSLVV